MTDTLFYNIENHIINEIMLAKQSIKIAVAWFNLQTVLDILTLKAKGGISIEIILQYDDINTSSPNSLDFSEFKENGGILIWAHCRASTMHEKFCVIDDEVVLHGTYNWTNRAEKKNDEHLCICKEEPNMAAKFSSRFFELKDKYSSDKSGNNPQIKQHNISKKKYQPKVTRLRAFMEDMAKSDLSKYAPEYLKSFRDYWTEETSSTKMRFETKADFLMEIELSDWGNKKSQIEDEIEYESFKIKAKEEAIAAYEDYSISIKEAIASISYKEQLEGLKKDFNESAALYHELTVNKVLGEKKYKTSVYDYLVRCHAPAIILIPTTHPVGRKLYGNCYSIDGGSLNTRYLPILHRLESCLNKDFVKEICIPAIDELPPKEEYIKKYIDSCVFNSRFSSRISQKNGYLTKEKISFVLEAYYALKYYEEHLNEIVRTYGDFSFGEVYKQIGKECPDKIDSILICDFINMYHSNLKIEISAYFNYYSFNFSLIGLNTFGYVPKYDNSLDKINNDLKWNVQRISIGYIGYKNYNYDIPDEVYYAKHGYRFCTVEDACNFDPKRVEYKSILYYYNVLKDWPSNG